MMKLGSRKSTNHVIIIVLTFIVIGMLYFGMIQPTSFAEAALVASEQQMDGGEENIMDIPDADVIAMEEQEQTTTTTFSDDGDSQIASDGDGDGEVVSQVIPDVVDTATVDDTLTATTTTTATTTEDVADSSGQSSMIEEEEAEEEPRQEGPFIDLLGPYLVSLQKVDDTHVMIQSNYTTDALRGKKVIGLYFSADWCGPCRAFTPELVSFYDKINSRRGRYRDSFEIVWISRCRDMNAFGQYFTKMGNWYALPAEEAMSQRGMMLSEKFKVKGIPHFVLLDEIGNVITLDGRNKIPQDRSGVGFPWRNPVSTLYMNLLPRSVRMMIKTNIQDLLVKVQSIFLLKRKAATRM